MVKEVVDDEMVGIDKPGVLVLRVMAKTKEEWDEWKAENFEYPPNINKR